MTSARNTGTVLTVAPTGDRAKAEVVHLPVTGDEVAAAAADCERIGASVIDLHPRQDTSVGEIVGAVRSRSNLIVRLAAYARSETLTELLESGAEILTCPLDAPAEFIADLRERAQASHIAVHYEARDLDQLSRLPEQAQHVVLVFGEHAMPGDLATLSAALEQLPRAATFTATGLDEVSVPVLLATLAAGGHPRVGMADTLSYAERTPARDNAQLVARAAGVAKIAQRPPVAPAEARRILGLTAW